ncbi:MAG: 50S ribosomal protein L9 [Clostridia bacterium]|nr:50S ribosomal protein L9 [Clostridia bacterium]
MEVILLEDVKGLGKKNELVKASDGYARNYLFKKNLAIEASKQNVNIMKNRQNAQKMKKNIELGDAKEIKESIDGKEIVLHASSGENGKLFGSITTMDIAEALKKNFRVIVDKKKIIMKEHIKSIGTHEIQIKIYQGVNATIKVNVIGE